MLHALPASPLDPRSAQPARAAAPAPCPGPATQVPVDTAALGHGEPAPPKKWTVLVYAAADNNLYDFEYKNLRDIEKVGSTADFNVVAQLDHRGAKGADRRLMLRQEGDSPKLASPVVERLGKTDMSDPKALADFIEWGLKTYPAEHTMLIINDHGGGWEGCVQDDGSRGWMKLPELQQGLQMAQDATGQKLDIIGFDACLMSMAEVTHQLEGNATFMVASQESEGGGGWPYSNILTTPLLQHLDSTLSQKLPLEPKDVATAVVAKASEHPQDTPTMAALDLSQDAQLQGAIRDLATAIDASSLKRGDFAKVIEQTQGFFMNGFCDLHDLCDKLQAAPGAEPALKAAAAACQQAVGRIVLAERHADAWPGAHGISIETETGHKRYGDLASAHDTGWLDAIHKMHGVHPAGHP